MGVPSIRYLEAFLYPLRSPSRFFTVAFLLLGSQFRAFLPFVLQVACVLGIKYLTDPQHSQ